VSLLLLESSSLRDHSLYQQLDALIAPQIQFISPVLADQYDRKTGYLHLFYRYFIDILSLFLSIFYRYFIVLCRYFIVTSLLFYH
jgi:hypothetical protein